MATYPPPSPTYVGPVAHDSGNGNKPLTRIVIHCTVGSDGKGATGTAAYFRDPDSRGSAHYITDANLTLQSAYDSVVCWHAPPNPHSIGIEMCCSLSNKGQGHWILDSHVKMMRRSARLVAELCLAYSIPAVKLTVAQVRAGQKGICGHIDVSNAFGESDHWDPGPYFPWSTFMAMVRTEVASIVAGSNPAPEGDWLTMATVAELAEAIELGNANYWRRFFADEAGTGDAIYDDMRAGFMSIVTTVAGATDEAVRDQIVILGTKVDEQTSALNRLAAAIEATNAVAPKA